MGDSSDELPYEEEYHDARAPQFTKLLDLTKGHHHHHHHHHVAPSQPSYWSETHHSLPPQQQQQQQHQHHHHHSDEEEDDDETMGSEDDPRRRRQRQDEEDEEDEDEVIGMSSQGNAPSSTPASHLNISGRLEPPAKNSSSNSSPSRPVVKAPKVVMPAINMGTINPETPGKVVEAGSEQTGRWTRQEHEAFLAALRMYGKEWKKVAAKVKTRTVVQTRTHAQKYFQKLQKAQESSNGTTDTVVEAVDMSSSNSNPTDSSKSKLTNKKKRPMLMAKGGRRSNAAAAALSSAAHVISNLATTTTNSSPVVVLQNNNHNHHHSNTDTTTPPPPRVHGFSTSDEIPSKSTSWAAAAGGMKIVAPDPLASLRRGNFPEPSPAATGKRKLAEIAAARMLAGVASVAVSLPPSRHDEEEYDEEEEEDDDDERDGAPTPPPLLTSTQPPQGLLDLKYAPPLPLGGSNTSSRKGLALHIVNPETLGVSHEKRRKLNGESGGESPVTPWDGQLEALVNEKAKHAEGEDSVDVPFPHSTASEQPFFHPVCGPGDAFGRSPLHRAVCDMDIESLHNQLADVANQSAGVLARLDAAGYCPLHTAAALRMMDPKYAVAATEVVRTLLAAGAEPNVWDSNGNSPLHWAARAGDCDVAETLLVKNCQLDTRNKHGETALHWGMRTGQTGSAVVALLIDNGARVGLANNANRRPIDVAGEGFLDDEMSVAALRARDIKMGNKKLSRELKKALKEALVETRQARMNLLMRSVPSRTLVLHHPECLEHVPKSRADWEAPDRVSSIMGRIEKSIALEEDADREILEHEVTLSSEFERAKLDLLSRVHSTEYLSFVQGLSKDLEKQVRANQNGKDGSGHGKFLPVVPFTPMVQRTMIKATESAIKDTSSSDTAFSVGSLRAARRAAGAVQHAVDCVLVGRNRNAFCVVRPPGHHAGVNGLLDGGESCGFCLFNNVAAGALYAISDDRLLCERCAIVDIDVHHGNGTEEIVRKCHDPSKLFFFSIHLYDNDRRKRGNNQHHYKFYPGTGSEDDLAMNIINVPLIPLWKEHSAPSQPITRTHNTRQKARSGDSQTDESPAGTPQGGGGNNSRGNENGSESSSAHQTSPRPPPPGAPRGAGSGRMAYREAIQSRLLPSLRAFNPDLILISAGFDATKGDVGNARHERGGEKIGLDLEAEDYAWTTRKILEIADICCNGRVVSVLEGGYGRSRPTPADGPATEDSSPSRDGTSMTAGASDESAQPLDRGIFSESAMRHLHALVDPYDKDHRFSSIH